MRKRFSPKGIFNQMSQMSKFRTIIVVATVVVSAWNVHAQTNFKKVGTTGYVFLEIPVTARTAGMGEASLTLDDGAEAVLTNPGLLGEMQSDHSLGVSYAQWFASTQHQSFAYAYHAGDAGVFGLNVVRLDYGTMTWTANGRNQGTYDILGTFTADAVAYGASFARQMTDKFSFGMTVKYVQERIASYKSTNALFDGGMVYNTGFHTLRIGGVVRNFGVDAKYLEGLFKMPTEFRLGASMDVFGDETSMNRITAAVEAVHPSDNNERVNAGIEYWFDNVIALRAGRKWNYDEEKWTAGAGLRWYKLMFDAAYADYGRLGAVVRLTLGMNI